MPKIIQPRIRDLLVRGCPFCGSFAIHISNTHTACYTVECEECGAEITGPSLEKSKWKTAARKISSHLDAIRRAVIVWNTRSPMIDGEMRPAWLQCNIHYGEVTRFRNLGGVFGVSGTSTGET
jgi:hypothetical protein